MTTRTVSPAHGLSWLLRALNPASGQLFAMIGASAFFLGGVMVVALVAGGLSSAWATGDGTRGFGLRLVTGALVMSVLGGLMVGYLRLLHAAARGLPVRSIQVFSGYADTAVAMRALVFIGLLALVQNALIGWLFTALSPGFVDWYLAVAASMEQAGPSSPPAPPPPPAGLGATFLLVAAVGLAGFAVQAIGLGQIAFSGRSVPQAFADGIRGTLANLLPLLLLLLATLVAGFALTMVLALAILVLGAVGSLAGPQAAALATAPVYFVFLLGAYVVMFRVMYHLWHDICGDAPARPEAPGQLEL